MTGADPRSTAHGANRLTPVPAGRLSPAELVRVLRPRLDDLVDATVSQIQIEVARYSGPRQGRRRRLIEAAVRSAVHYFVDALADRHHQRRQVDELFQKMGRSEALDGNDLQAMHAALEIATRDAWRELHDLAVEAGLAAADLGRLGDALFELMDRLTDQVAIGFHAARDEIGRATRSARGDLLTAILEQRPLADLRQLAAVAGWPLTERYVVVTVDTTWDAPSVDLGLLDPSLLMRLQAPVSVGLIPLSGADDGAAVASAVDELVEQDGVGRICVGWPVGRTEVAEAVRWGRRALDLARDGVLPAERVVWCADHTTTLWLQSEPLLRRKVAADLLAPLLRETPHSREVLSHTLLAWISTHDSAPVLAGRLGVHAQTVRYRLRRLRDLLGDRLDDADTALAIRLALEASLPLWAAGHLAADVELVR